MVTKTRKNRLADYLQRWLDEHKLTQFELADQAKLPRSTLNAIIAKGVRPNPDKLERLSAVMNVPMRQLLVLAGYLRGEELEPGQVTEEEHEVLLMYRKVPKDRRRLLKALLAELAAPDTR